MYILYVPDEKSITGFFFLALNAGGGGRPPGPSRWIGGVPPKETQ